MAEPKDPVETPEEEVVETPEVETKEQTPEVETPEVPETPESEPEEEPAPPSRRESLRIQQILEKRRQEEAPKPTETIGGIDYKTALDADPEVIAQLEADRKKVAEAQYQAGLTQAEAIKWETRLEVDAPRIESRYPVLDKNSTEFHPAVADALNKAYLNAVGFDPQTRTVQNPNLRYADYIEGMMELADEVSSTKVSKTTQNITKQAAQTGLRPDGSAAKRLNLNKDAQDMSDEELAAKLASFGM